MTLALVFPGQGTQHPAMLPWLAEEPAAAATLAALAGEIGSDWRDRLHDSAWASDNRVAQSLITGASLAAWQALAPLLPQPAAIAGYSVGEVPAFCAAGVYDAATALHLARVRALAMAAAVTGKSTGLLAVQGASAAALDATCCSHGLAVAIRMSVDRVVLGGTDEALNAAAQELSGAGARCTRLAVHVASHTPWMRDAAAAFAHHLEPLPFAAPRAALVCNLDAGTPRRSAGLKAALAGQIAHTVPWDACMDALAERRVGCVLEVGPGSTLAALWNERHPGIPARSADEFRSVAAVARWVQAALRG